MSRKLLLTTLLLITASVLYAESGFRLDDKSLITVLQALKDDSRAYTANEAYNKGGRLQHDAAMSQYGLQLNGTLDSAGQNSFNNSASGIEVNNNFSLSAGPQLSFSQLLPSYGTLSGSITDKLTGSGIETSNSPILPQRDPSFNNELSLSIGLAQPLYFGDAYDASLTKIDESLEITNINYLNNRNILIISAVEDYYNLLKTKYQVELISVRLETNSENLRRMEKEYQLGVWTQSHLNSARAASLQAEADLLKAEQTYTAARELLSSVYGLELSVQTGTDSAITAFSAEDLEKVNLHSLYNNNPDIRLSLNQIAIAESDIVLTEQQSAMVLNAGGSYKITSGLTETSFADNLSLSLTLSSSIIDSSSAENTLAVKQNEISRLQNELEDKQKRIESQIKLLINNITLGRKLSEIYSLQEETSRFEYEKGLKEFELGGITQKDLLELQIELENTRLSLLLNKIDNNLAVLQLYKLLGFDLEAMLIG